MPAYSQSATRTMNPGDSITLFNAETVTQGESSIAVAIAPVFGGGNPQLCLSVKWGSAPTATVTVQGSTGDVDADYVATATTSANKQTDLLTFATPAPFVRVNVSAYSAGGALTATIVRLS